MSIARILTKNEFELSPEKKLYGSYEKYISAQVNQLRTTSAWTFNPNFINKFDPTKAIQEYFNKKHDKFNQKSEELIAQYKALEPEMYKAKSEYRQYASKMESLGDDATTSQKSKLLRLKNDANDAELSYDAALSKALYHTHSAAGFLS